MCGWPASVAPANGCSATLIHPEIVAYAGHCGTGHGHIVFGEARATGIQVPTEYCTKCDCGDDPGHDLAYCKLETPVDFVEPAPPLMGCELNYLEPGREVVSVGFGNADTGPTGIKRFIEVPIQQIDIPANLISIGGGGKGLCGGDSGGSTYIKYPDGAWRVFGISIGIVGECGSESVLALMHGAVPWIEADSGIDVTPCHDADGTWNPGPDCADFPMESEIGSGAWPTCDVGAVLAEVKSCGPPYNAAPDGDPPTVSFITPDGDVMVDDPIMLDVEIAADDGDGWGIAKTYVIIDGNIVNGSEDDYPPYVAPPLGFNEGIYEIVAAAEDYAGNVGMSAPLTVTVGDPDVGETGGTSAGTTGADTTGGETGSASNGEAGDASAGTTGAETGGETTGEASGDDSGCGCASPDRSPSPLAGLVLIMLAARRRRSRR